MYDWVIPRVDIVNSRLKQLQMFFKLNVRYIYAVMTSDDHQWKASRKSNCVEHINIVIQTITLQKLR